MQQMTSQQDGRKALITFLKICGFIVVAVFVAAILPVMLPFFLLAPIPVALILLAVILIPALSWLVKVTERRG